MLVTKIRNGGRKRGGGRGSFFGWREEEGNDSGQQYETGKLSVNSGRMGRRRGEGVLYGTLEKVNQVQAAISWGIPVYSLFHNTLYRTVTIPHVHWWSKNGFIFTRNLTYQRRGGSDVFVSF